jgi:hypothetical protein
VRRFPIVVFALGVAGVASCGESKPPAKAPPPPTASLVKAEKSFATVPRGTLGPYLAVHEEGALAVWAYGDDELGWLSRSLDHRGVGRGPVRRVAESTSTPELVRLVPYGKGYLAAWSGTSTDGPTLATLHLLADGRLAGPPQALPPPEAAPLWLEVIPTPDGGLLVWAENAAHGAALFARAVDAGGAGVSDTVSIPGTARAWQAVEGHNGAVLATVGMDRKLRLVQLSSTSEVVATHEVPSLDRVNAEIDVARVADRLMYAFTAKTSLESRVFVGVAELDGAPLAPPRPAVRAFGEQKLVRLVGGEQKAFLVWQDYAQDPGWLKVTPLNADGASAAAPLQIPFDGTLPEPEFQTIGDQFRTLAWACVESIDCTTPKVPVQLDFAEDLTPKRVNPWMIEGRVPDMAWNLACRGERCLGLAALFGDTTEVHAVGAKTTPGQWSLPAFLESPQLPRARDLHAALQTLPLSGFDAQALEGGSLVSWLSYFDPAEPYVVPKTPAPDGRLAPVRAQLWTQWVPGEDAGTVDGGLPAANVISYRAHSPGGVALSGGSKGHLLVWSAIDGKHPQVFTTLIDDRGKKVAQQMLTRQQGNVQQVMAVPSDDGWFVGWIDDRSGQLKPAVTRLGARLERKVPDRVLGGEKANATGAALAHVQSELWLATANALEGGVGNIELTRLDGRNLQVIESQSLGDGDTNDHSPIFLTGTSETLLAFVRQAKDRSRVHVQRLGGGGVAPSGAFVLETHHDAIAFSGQCARERCRVLVTTESDQTQFLEAVSFTSSEVGGVNIVATIAATSALEIPPLLRGNEGWFYDLNLRGEPRLFRANLEF